MHTIGGEPGGCDRHLVRPVHAPDRVRLNDRPKGIPGNVQAVRRAQEFPFVSWNDTRILVTGPNMAVRTTDVGEYLLRPFQYRTRQRKGRDSKAGSQLGSIYTPPIPTT